MASRAVLPEPLPPRFFQRPVEEVARDLLGTRIVSRCGGRTTEGFIVETEAYLGFDDPASHAYRGRRNPSNQTIYGPPGGWYIYRSYGIHWCANLVAGDVGVGAAVLLRGLHPVRGQETMRRRRSGARDVNLANGPGKLTQALGITRRLDGQAMWESLVQVVPGMPIDPKAVARTPRIGISKATTLMLRYAIDPSFLERTADQ